MSSDDGLDVTGAEAVGLAVAEGVVQVDLAVRGRQRPVRRDDDQRVERQVVRALEHPGDDGGAEAPGLLGEHGDERPVQRLGGRGEVVVGGAEVVHRPLGQHHEVGPAVEVAESGLDEGPIGGRVGARRQLHEDRIRHCLRSRQSPLNADRAPRRKHA